MKKLFRIAFVIILLAALVSPVFHSRPVLAASSTFYPSASAEDGFAYRSSEGSWTGLRNGAGTHADDSNTYATVQIEASDVSSTWIDLYRCIAMFDTSALPDNCTITSATLSLYGVSKLDELSSQPNINIYSANPAGTSSIIAADFTTLGTTAYSTAITYSNWSTSGYNDFTLNSTGLAAISKTGVSKFGIRNANYDVLNVEPVWQPSFAVSYLRWYTYEQGAGYKPKLVVNYTEIVAPEITADDASNIGQTTARLNSTLNDDGNDTCEVRFGYGDETQTAENFANYDTITDWVDGYTSGEHPYVDVSSLVADTGYFYRVQAKNDADTTTSSGETTFTTEASLNEPSNFKAIPEANTINLSWTKGSGSTNTLIRYRLDTYPTTTSDGTELYESTGSSTQHTGLEAGTTIYYSAWGESGGGYSASYTTLLVTTLAGQDVDVDLTTPSEPTNWFLEVDYSTQVNNPLYGTINQVADSISMPRTTAWLMAGIMVSMVGGFFVFAWRKNLLAAAITMGILMALASAMQLVPGWILFLTLVIIIAVALTMRRLQ